jgi:four helix bundle protein
MGVRRPEELIAFQLAEEFKLGVYRLIEDCRPMVHDYKYRDQLWDATSGIERCVGEGFRRKRPAEFSMFLRYALGSLEESIIALKDGVSRKYFTTDGISAVLKLARRCEAAIKALKVAQDRFREEDRKRPRPRSAPRARLPPPGPPRRMPHGTDDR